jgi:hypothetical protein
MGIMSLAEIMDSSIEILKKYIKTIITFNLAYGALSLAGIFGFIIVGSMLTIIAVALKLSAVVIGIIFSILGVGIFALIMCFRIGLIKISSQEFLEERIYASQAIGASFKKIFKVLGVLILEVLIFLPVVAIFALIAYLAYGRLQQSMVFYGIYDKSEIGLIILIIVVLLLGILSILAYVTIFSFSFHVMTIENKGVFASLKRSYTLVKGDYFKILGCTIIFSLTISAITYSLQSFVGIVASIIFAILKFLNIQQSILNLATMVYSISQWPISILSWLIISPLGTIMITYLYYNQRFKKEGYDITLKLNKMQKAKAKEKLREAAQYNDSI